VCPGYDELLLELRARELVEREPDEREVLARVAPLLLAVALLAAGLRAAGLRAEAERLVDRVGAFSATALLTLSKSLRTLWFAFLASRCKFFSALVTSLYALCALRSSPLPADCSVLCASSSSFSRRCCARSRLRRAGDDADDDDDDDARDGVERADVERAVVLRAVVLRAAGLRAAGFLAAGGIAVSSYWGLMVTRVGKALRNARTHVAKKLPDARATE
jgi:hypothetical protein